MDRLVVPVLTATAAEVIATLADRPGLAVVAVAVDLSGDGGLDVLREAALIAGASRCHAIDKCEELARGVLWPALRAGALTVPGEPVLTALSMPVVAEAVVEISRHERATGVAVWLDDLRDRQRLRALIRDLAPTLGLVGIPMRATIAGTSTIDSARPTETRNLWARVETPARTEIAPRPATNGVAAVRIGFERGVPATLNGVHMAPGELIRGLTAVVGGQGAGVWTVQGSASAASWRVDAPAALALAVAMDAMASRTLDMRTSEVAATMAEAYAEVIRDGAWFNPVRAGLDAFVDRVLAGTVGDVELRIVDGQIEVQA